MKNTNTELSAKKSAKLLFPPWNPFVAIIIIVASFFGASLIAELLLLLAGLISGKNLENVWDWLADAPIAQFAAILITYSLMALAVYWFVRRHHISMAALGVVRPRLRDLGIAILAIPPYIISLGLIMVAVTALFPGLDVEQEQQLGFEPTNDVFVLAITFISLAVLPPLVEEFVMRGFLFTSFLGRYRFLIATLVTSLVFGAAHLQFGSGEPLLWVAAIDTFIISLALCYMRFKTGSLWSGIILHGIKNTLAFSILFLAPLWGFEIAAVLQAL